MKWYKKNLPPGFTYLINKKEVKEIDDSIGNKIIAVFLDGTAYTESKIYKNWTFGKTSVRIHFDIKETDEYKKYLNIYIYLYGVRESNFEIKEQLILEKNRVKQELFDKISKNMEAFENNHPISKREFIDLKYPKV